MSLPNQKSKKELIEETTGIRKSQITKLLNKTKDNTKASRLKYLLYLHSKNVSKERFEVLLRNGNLLVRNWDEVKKIMAEIKPEEFEEYPIVKKYFEIWCNSLLGESAIYRVGNGNIKEGMKYAKKLFKTYQLEKMEEEIVAEEEQKPLGTYYIPKFTDEQLKSMRSLEPEGYKGFYCFHALGTDNKMKSHIIYDRRFLTPEEYIDPYLLPQKIQEIYHKFSIGLIK